MTGSHREDGYLSYPSRTNISAILFSVLFLVIPLLSYSTVQLWQGIEKVREAQTDNRIWNVAQLEVEYQRFLLTLREAAFAVQINGAVLSENQIHHGRDFDILYSRISTFISTLRFFERPADTSEIIRTVSDIRDKLDQALTEASSNEMVLRNFYDFQEMSEDYLPSIRDLSVRSMQIVNADYEEKRLNTLSKLKIFFAITAFFMLMTLGLLLLSLRLNRDQFASHTHFKKITSLVGVAFENAATAIFVCNSDGRILLTNTAATSIFQLSMSELVGRNLAETVVPKELERDYQRLMRFFQRHESGPDWASDLIRVRGQRRTGASFSAQLVVRKVNISNDESVLVVFVRDISDQVLSEQRLENALKDARKHAAAQGRFLATMSHELRTPLHGVVVGTDLLTLMNLEPEAEALVRKVGVSAQHSLQQIDFALEAIRSVEVSEPEVAFDPFLVVKQIVDEARLVAHESGTEFALEFHRPNVTQLCMGRPRAYHRALVNLVGNAAKFAAGGKITIRIGCHESAATQILELKSEVIDNGPGIPPDRIDRIFEPYTKWNTDLNQPDAVMGFGLGLWIARQAVVMMGGTLSVDSVVGQGCHFTITNTLQPVRSAQIDEELASKDRFLKSGSQPDVALVVDDCSTNTVLMSQMLSALGYEVAVAYSGEEAITKALHQKYDVILMDFFMPGMNGDEAVAQIRAGGASVDAIILGITARIDLDVDDNPQAQGMTAVLHKPFGMSQLRDTLAELSCLPAQGRSRQPEQRRKPDIALIVRQRFQELGMPLLRDTVEQSLVAAEQAERQHPTASATAHKIAGAALMLGLDRLGNELLALQRALKKGESATALGDHIARLREATLEVSIELHAIEEV